MLTLLRIQNLAIVEQSEVEFGPGLNVLTGETGAGKSIILKAIDLLLGRRASSDILRSGTDRCTVEGLFRIPRELGRILREEHDELEEVLPEDEDELLLRRIIDASGRSKVYVNGQLMALGGLASLSARLMDVTGQHQQHILFDPLHHRELLDAFGVSDELKARVAVDFAAYADAKRSLDRFLSDTETRAVRMEKLAAERDELSEAALQPGERAALDAELIKLASVETLGSTVQRCLELLEESDDSLDEKLRALSLQLESAAAIDPALDEVVALVDAAAVQLSEAQLTLGHYGAKLEADPLRLEQLRDRLALVARLERKYARPGDEIIAYLETISAELAEYEGGALDEGVLRKRLSEARATLDTSEQALTAARKAAAVRLSKEVEREFPPLNMQRATFEVAVNPAPSSTAGADGVEFLLAANPGEPARALGKVASGGELSRVLLILKTVLNEQRAPGTQVFDEVDSGIGGAVAQIVGEKLLAVSRRSQVILITHAPQIASLADQHFLVEKRAIGDRTTSSIRVLNEHERVAQIAGMLAGKSISANFEQSAKELLATRSSLLSKASAVKSGGRKPATRPTKKLPESSEHADTNETKRRSKTATQ